MHPTVAEHMHNLECHIGVPETYLHLISKESKRIPINVPLSSTKNPLVAHMYAAALFHIFSNKQFDSLPFSETSALVFGLMAREGIDLKTHINVAMTGTDSEQHYKLWRYCFSTYLYTKNLCTHKDLANFLMLCVDYSFYLKNSFQRDVFLYYIFDLMTCGVTYKFDFSKIFTYTKNSIISNSCLELVVLLEQFKQSLLPSYSGTNISSTLSAFFKLSPDTWQTFASFLKSQDYRNAEKLCFTECEQ